nr:hypothetical protein [uncultured Tyzzerella sp.]
MKGIKFSNLGDFKKIKDKQEIIEQRKILNKYIKESKNKSKKDCCYYCGKKTEKFCNSHTIPQFTLKNISKNGKVNYFNTILELQSLNSNKGLNESGTFKIICRDCDSKIFSDYEDPNNYNEKPTYKMLAQIEMKNNLQNINKRLIEIEFYNILKNEIFDKMSEEEKTYLNFIKKICTNHLVQDNSLENIDNIDINSFQINNLLNCVDNIDINFSKIDSLYDNRIELSGIKINEIIQNIYQYEYIEKIEKVNKLDLAEFEESFINAKKSIIDDIKDAYSIKFYEELDYVVPIAFQGTITLNSDLEGNIINNIYNMDTNYKIKNFSSAIFPLKDKSIIIIFVDKENKRYDKFFKQLNNLSNLDDKLSLINYIIFSYSEEYFISPEVNDEILKKLLPLAQKTSTGYSLEELTDNQKMEDLKRQFNFKERNNYPNLLSNKFALNFKEN